MSTESQWTSRPKGFLAHFCFICTLVFFKATCVCFCTCMWLDSWQQASDVCVYPHVCLLVLNPPLQSDSPLSGIKKGGGWLVGLVVGCCFSSTLKLSERMELDWTFLNGTLCRDTAELGQVLKGPGKTIQEYIQYLQITNAYLFWFSKMKRLPHEGMIRGSITDKRTISHWVLFGVQSLRFPSMLWGTERDR